MNLPPPLHLSVRDRALVTPLRCELPEVCVFTGGTQDLVRVKQRLPWHHPAIYLGVFAGLLIYVILALSLRKTADVTYYMTRAEEKRRRKWHTANWGIFLSSIIWIMLGASTEQPWLYWLIPLTVITSITVYFLKVRLLYPQKVADDHAEIRGISMEVMAQLVCTHANRNPVQA